MKRKKYVLDLYCGAGGAAVGIDRAGFQVVGIDIKPQPNYPFPFFQLGAIQFLKNLTEAELKDVLWIWSSPPCQAHSWSAKRWISGARNQKKRKYPDMIAKTRKLLDKTGKPYIIENVAGAPLKNKVMLCGLMFNLGVNRHRYFESNVKLETPEHRDCRGRIQRGEALTVAGHGGNSKSYKLTDWQKAMGIDWMNKRPNNSGSRKRPGNREDLCESVPPAYAEFLANQMKTYL